MVVDLGELARGLATLADLDLAVESRVAVDRAVGAARGLLGVDTAGLLVVDLDGQLRWVSLIDDPEPMGAAWLEPVTAGPAVTALEELRPVVVEDLAADPDRQTDGRAAGTGSVLCVPVLVDGTPVGALQLFRVTPGSWDARQIATARTFAGLLGVLLSAIVAAATADELAVQLQHALQSRIEIEQAKGVLMARHGWTAQTAWERLRGTARSSRRTAVAVARELLAGVHPAAAKPRRTG